MRRLALLLTGVLLASPAVLADDPVPEKSDKVLKAEFHALQGTWLYESMEEDGKKVEPDKLKTKTFHVGANVFLIRDGLKLVQAGKLTLEPTKKTKGFEALVEAGPKKGDTLLGVYEIDKDTMKLCYDPAGQDRPAKFESAAKSGVVCAVLKRKYPTPALEIVGKYTSETIESSGAKLTTEVTIEKRGDSYLLSYRNATGGLIYVATGIRSGDTLSTSWVSSGQVGVSVYKIEKGPKLVGQYTPIAGVGLLTTETLVPYRRLD